MSSSKHDANTFFQPISDSEKALVADESLFGDFESVSPVQMDCPDTGITYTSFESFGLNNHLAKAILDLGYQSPTPIQVQAIPVVLSGVDVMGAAQTGTGKTAGFALPILHRLLPFASRSTSPAKHPVRALVLTPTRELADQVASNVSAYAKYTPLRSTVVYGGVDMNAQIQALKAGVELVIATPGRLLDHVQQKTIQLNQVQVLVLDEADRMLDMGFLPDLQRIINLLPKVRQNLLFSATFSSEIQRLAKSFMVQPTLIEVAKRNATSENIEQNMFFLESEEDKREAVAHLIVTHQLNQVIVFTNTKLGAARLARHLESLNLKATAIHGDKTQIERTKALDAFKVGEVAVLVATDVAARGLDIADLPCVINYDLPNTPEDYVHRIGRTGRAGAKGVAYSLYTQNNERTLRDIAKLIGIQFAPRALDGFVSKNSRVANLVLDDRVLSRRGQHKADLVIVEGGERHDRYGDVRNSKRYKAYLGSRFDDTAPIDADAEFERLRAKLAMTQVNDTIFTQPYQEPEKLLHGIRSQSNNATSTLTSIRSSNNQQQIQGVAWLLGKR